ncbi:MAG TPA: hypothetical protein PKU80_00185 [Candidatus Limiplasma sp.]|nr:hypothetical protein [Candidatus Limiplasma sp.]HRX09752.1 hypothetical protein [Candidatus Limiplasma sp.]
MTNAMLRKQAWKAYCENRGQLWIVFALTTVLNFGWGAIQRFLLPSNALVSLVGHLYGLAILPITVFGMIHVLLRLVQGKSIKASMIFDTFKAPFHLLKLYAAGVVTLFPIILLAISNLTGMPAITTGLGLIVYLVIALCLIFLYIWFSLRMFLFTYLVVLDPEESLRAQIKISFRTMKKRLWRLIWFSITITFPLILLLVLIISLTIQYMYQPDVLNRLSDLFLIANPVLTIFYLPYVYLSYTAYATSLLELKR